MAKPDWCRAGVHCTLNVYGQNSRSHFKVERLEFSFSTMRQQIFVYISGSLRSKSILDHFS